MTKPERKDDGALPREQRPGSATRDTEAGEPGPALGPGTSLAGKFLLLEVLGEGAFGTVYKARHQQLDEDVALKVLKPEVAGSKRTQRRFLREVRTSRAFLHRYSVPLREFGRDPQLGCLYFTMDYVPGRTLETILREDGVQPSERVVPLVVQALEALGEAHRIGFVHRDIKPANLMVTHGLTDGEEIRILDFGVAKAVSLATPTSANALRTRCSASTRRRGEEALTRAGSLVGTLAYMSPEQASGRRLDRRSDLYSLGVVLYEILCGRLPHEPARSAEDEQPSLRARILHDPPQDPHELVPSLPAPLRRVMLRALEKGAAGRFQDAHAFRAALLATLERRNGASDSSATPRLGGLPRSRSRQETKTRG